MKEKVRDNFSHFGAKNLTIFLILLLIVGCKNPFGTRKPEEPQQRRSSWMPPTAPEIVMENLKSAMNEGNGTNYLRCLAKDPTLTGQVFQFEADQATILKNPGVFENWDFQNESNYINLLFSKVSKDSLISLFFDRSEEGPISQDTVVCIREYNLSVPHTMASDQYPRRMKGRGEFHLSRKNDGDWVIHFWRDTAIEDYPSWSDLKAYAW